MNEWRLKPVTRKSFIFFYNYFNWRLITLQYCGGFCHTAQYLSYPPEVLLASTHTAQPSDHVLAWLPHGAARPSDRAPRGMTARWLLLLAVVPCSALMSHIFSSEYSFFKLPFSFLSLSVFVSVQRLEKFFFFIPTQLLTLSLKFLFQNLVKKERLVLMILFLHQEEKLK